MFPASRPAPPPRPAAEESPQLLDFRRPPPLQRDPAEEEEPLTLLPHVGSLERWLDLSA